MDGVRREQRPVLVAWGWAGMGTMRQASSVSGSLLYSMVMGAQLLFLTVLKPLGRKLHL